MMKRKKAYPKQNRKPRNLNKIGSIDLIKIPLFFLIAVFFLFSLKVASSDNLKTALGNKDYGDALIDASIADARTLVPILASDSASGAIVGMVFNGLVKYNKDLELVGDLAESWDIEDEGLTIIFHLRKNVKWHDGEPFTADDVKFTYEKLISPSVPTPYSGDFKKVKSFQVLDPYTIKITYEEPFSPGLASWGMAVMPKHILGSKNLLTTEFKRDPIGTGPYIFKRWKAGERNRGRTI